MQTALRHKRQKPQCFQADGFSDGIRTGNDERVKIFANGNVNRDRRFGVQKGVTGLAQMDAAVPPQCGSYRVHTIGQLPPRENTVQTDQQIVIVLNIFPMRGGVRRQFR